MVIEKKTTITPMTTDGKAIVPGYCVVFEADGKCFAGTFQSITQRGSMQFRSAINPMTFNVMPSSIEHIFLADIMVDEDHSFPMNPPVED